MSCNIVSNYHLLLTITLSPPTLPHSLNLSVSPSPVTLYLEMENITYVLKIRVIFYIKVIINGSDDLITRVIHIILPLHHIKKT